MRFTASHQLVDQQWFFL